MNQFPWLAVIIWADAVLRIASIQFVPYHLLTKQGDAILGYDVLLGQAGNESGDIMNLYVKLEEKVKALEAQMASNKERDRRIEATERLSDYMQIKLLNPTLWLSAHYFAGLTLTPEEAPVGLAPLMTDTIGNPIITENRVYTVNDGGRSAYNFDKTNSIKSEIPVSNKFTFLIIYKRLEPANNKRGRFFSSATGNRLFASFKNFQGSFYMENWISTSQSTQTATDNIEMYVATNDDGVKDMWHFDKQIVAASTAGANDWNNTVIGKPYGFPLEATNVYVYEALVCDKVLSPFERSGLVTILRKYLHI